jgi:hypothetical protein
MENKYQALMTSLEAVYGTANDKGFGSTVYHEASLPGESISELARRHYTKFLGKQWNSSTEKRWMSVWKKVYERPGGAKKDILAELASVSDQNAQAAIPLLTELIENADAGKKALAAAFNHPDLSTLAIHTIGDGEAMSGVMVSGLYGQIYSCSVIALMD